MLKRLFVRNFFRKISLFSPVFLLSLGISHAVIAAPAQSPLYLTQSASPMVALVMSADHELFKKAYNDYSNLDGGNLRLIDTTYRNDFDYYGYFDTDWCYEYVTNSTTGNSYFAPGKLASNHQCTGTDNSDWSGNFLNWATMTRVDILRRVLYGGKRSEDSDTRTVLERAFLPKDTHAFVKVYTGNDANRYTPYGANTPVSLCNVSSGDNGYPTIRAASGAWRQWSASEGQQCRWRSESNYATNPSTGTGGQSLGTLVAKVEVCKSGKDSASSRCKIYSKTNTSGVTTYTYKPIGLLQRRGESGKISFALMTGSYKSSLAGGVLRKKASKIANNTTAAEDEVDLETGKFTGVNGIIKNIDALKIASYKFADNRYTDCNTFSIPIATVKGQATDGQTCNDWGNPLGEIYMEALRYLTGNSVTNAFAVDDTVSTTYFPGVPGLTRVAWNPATDDPIPSDNWCANCSIIVLSTGTNSFDGDNLGALGLPDLANAAAVKSYTDAVGNMELGGSFTGSYFGGSASVSTTDTRQCQARSLTKLSDLVGVCPESPALEGTYTIAGLAYYAKTKDTRTSTAYPEAQTFTTYAVDLAESLPSFKVPVGSGNVSFLPACESKKGSDPWLGCSLIDVQVESLVYSGANPVSGSYLFYWEDSLWGNDYDLDGVQRIQFCVGAACGGSSVGANQIRITSTVPYAFAGNALRFNYTVTGTTADGLDNVWSDRPGSSNFDALKVNPDPVPANVTSKTKIFTAGSTSTTLLKKPLFYAAKYGGFTDSDNNNQPNLQSEWDANGDGLPDNYFNVSNPALLETSLDSVLTSIVDQDSSASSAAVSSTRLSEGAFVYQARFNSTKWSGELAAYRFSGDGDLGSSGVDENGNAIADLTTNSTMPTSEASMRIYTSGSSTALNANLPLFTWANLNNEQRFNLVGRTYVAGQTLTAAQITAGQSLLNWVRGSATGEGTVFRDRGKTADGSRRLLGDIINSSPVYEGGRDMRYDLLPGTAGQTYAAYLATKKAKTPRIFVGSNDGMVHAFNANTLGYLFSYLPDGVYPKLSKVSQTNYGTEVNPHQYLMDGQMTVSDAYINGQWRSVLVGTLGAGGKSVFGLDVTNTVPKLLFEYKSHPSLAEDLGSSRIIPRLGHVLGKPFIVPMINGRFAAVFGNGYESGNSTQVSTSSLFVIDLADPAGLSALSTTRIINALSISGSGLSAVELLIDNLGQIITAYAGDIRGGMWKFDVSNTNKTGWGATKLFNAVDADGNVQPITAAPTLGRNKQLDNKIMVYFGTGKYFDSTDNQTNTFPRQSLYAIADKNSLLARSDLHEKTLSQNPSGDAREILNDVVTWPTSDGWFLDFDVTASERITVKPLLLFDRLIFPTLVPNPSACGFGGTSWLMEVTAVGDKNVGETLLDENIKNDFLILGDLSFGVLPGGNSGKIIASGTDGRLSDYDAPIDTDLLGRMTWRQLD